MTKLSNHAKSALDLVAEKHLVYTIARATIEAELKLELEDRVSSYRIERDLAMRLADESGVPRTQLGKAIGTTNYRTVQEILVSASEGVPHIDRTSTKYSLVVAGASLSDWLLTLTDVGPGSVSGAAVVREVNGELVHVDGDEFVIPQAYRQGYAEEILEQITKVA